MTSMIRAYLLNELKQAGISKGCLSSVRHKSCRVEHSRLPALADHRQEGADIVEAWRVKALAK